MFPMTRRFRRAALAAAALGFLLGPAAGAQDEELLKVSCSVLPKRLSRGEEGKVLLKLTVPQGILISAQPSFIIEFSPVPEIGFPKNFFTALDLNLGVVEEPGQSRLDLSKPIEIPFTVSPDAKPGGHILEGRIKYFARSPDEGWCYKTTSKFSVAFSTRAASVKKS